MAFGSDADSMATMVGCITAHRAEGGMVVLATHIDLGIDAAATLSLEDFAVAAGETG